MSARSKRLENPSSNLFGLRLAMGTTNVAVLLVEIGSIPFKGTQAFQLLGCMPFGEVAEWLKAAS
jgi:hypothetical protein